MNLRMFAVTTTMCLLIGSSLHGQTNPPPISPPAGTNTALSVMFSGTSLYDALVSDAAQSVERTMQERDSERWKWIGIVASVIAALIGFWGIRSFSDLRNKVAQDIREDLEDSDLMKRLVESSVQAHVTADIDKRLHVVAKELAFYRLSNLASSLRSGTGFTNTERDAAMASLDEIRTETSIIKRKEFADVLEKIVDAFTSADLDFQVDVIELQLSPIIEETSGIVQTLIHHYGMRVIGEVQPDAQTLDRFKKYAAVCKRRRLYELALPHMMVLEYRDKKNNWQSIIDGLIQDAENLEDKELATVKNLLVRNADPTRVAKKPTGQVLRFSQAYEAFLAEYCQRLNISRTTPPTVQRPAVRLTAGQG